MGFHPFTRLILCILSCRLFLAYAQDTPCTWEGHCVGASCAADTDCSSPYACVDNVCTELKAPADDPNCNWLGHCLGAKCQTYNDCADPWPCVGGVCSNCTGSCGTGSFTPQEVGQQRKIKRASSYPHGPNAKVLNNLACDYALNYGGQQVPSNKNYASDMCLTAALPARGSWVKWQDMFDSNKDRMRAAGASDQEIGYIWDAIVDVAEISKVDARLILAIVMKQSRGNPRASSSFTVNGINSAGLMQTHNGTEFDKNDPAGSIKEMIQGGTQGTDYGDGLVQGINQFNGYFQAIRYYESGLVADGSNLCLTTGATDPNYVIDIANRLLGWLDPMDG